MPASRTTGTSTFCLISSMWCGLEMPRPDPIGDPAGITAAHPASASRRARIGSSVVYGRTVNPSATSTSAARSSSTPSGSRVRSSPITSSLIRSVVNASRAIWAVLIASPAVKQPAVFGRIRTPSRSSMGSSPGPAASTRRSATVTRSVSDATIASSRAARLFAPPVPRISPFSGRNVMVNRPVRR